MKSLQLKTDWLKLEFTQVEHDLIPCETSIKNSEVVEFSASLKDSIYALSNNFKGYCINPDAGLVI